MAHKYTLDELIGLQRWSLVWLHIWREDGAETSTWVKIIGLDFVGSRPAIEFHAMDYLPIRGDGAIFLSKCVSMLIGSEEDDFGYGRSWEVWSTKPEGEDNGT